MPKHQRWGYEMVQLLYSTDYVDIMSNQCLYPDAGLPIWISGDTETLVSYEMAGTTFNGATGMGYW